MHLEHLGDLELTYRDMPTLGTDFVLVRPYDSEEGAGYGEGDGKVSGPQLNGVVRWVNHPCCPSACTARGLRMQPRKRTAALDHSLLDPALPALSLPSVLTWPS